MFLASFLLEIKKVMGFIPLGDPNKASGILYLQ